MKRHLLAFLALGCIALVAAARADSYSHRETFSRTGAFSATGPLTLENVNGNVTVRTWDKNEILIEGEKSAKTAEELAAIDLKIDVSSDHADVKVKLPKRAGWFSNNIRAAVSFTITLPKTATVAKLETVNASVSIDGVQGSVRATTVNGAIEAARLGGDVHFETVNGHIRVDGAALHAGQRLSTETVNGGITIALPRDTSAEVHASVVNGHIDCDFPLTLKHGGVRRHKLDATIGHGGAEISAETVNGGITIKSV